MIILIQGARIPYVGAVQVRKSPNRNVQRLTSDSGIPFPKPDEKIETE